MKLRQKRIRRTFSVEHLESRALLSGGPQGVTSLAPGSLNPAFGTGGIATSTILGHTNDVASGVAIQQQRDGKIVVAGTARGVQGQSAFAVARYDLNGNLDTNFANSGTAFTEFVGGSVAATASAVAIQADGKIVVAGTVQGTIDDKSIEDFALARYNTDGSLDKSFGQGGEVLTDFGPDTFSSASSIAISGDKIIVAGTSTISGNFVFAVAQYNKNGKLDQGFGSGGEATNDFGPNFTIFGEAGVAVQPKGQIVLSGTVANFSGGFTEDFGLARYNKNGTLDTTFGTGGVVTTGFGSSNAQSVAGIAIEPVTGAIVVAGTVLDPAFTQDLALARYNPKDGSLDTSFGTGGVVITPSAPSTTTTAAGVTIQPGNGAIVVTGTTSGFDSDSNFFQDLTLARYRAADGSLDTGFGTGGEVLTDFGAGSRTTGAGAGILANGKIVASGTVTFISGGTVAGFGLAGFRSDGGVDRGFGTRGEVITNVPGPSTDITVGEAIQADGKIIVAGTASVFGPTGTINQDFALTRFNADGSVDTRFGNGGSVLTDFGTGTNVLAGVTIQPDGKIVVAGTIEGTINGEFVQDFGLARYNTDGTLDRSFGNRGEVITDFGPDTSATAGGIAIGPDGTIVVAGSASGFDSDDNFFQDLAVARYGRRGALDTTFGTGGKVLTSLGPDTSVTASGVAIQSSGKIVVAATAVDPETFNNEFAVVRYNVNGTLDSSFGTGGQVFTALGPDTSLSASGIALQPNGKILVAGTFTDFDSSATEFALFRYNQNGSMDSSFGMGGEVLTSLGQGVSAFAAGLALQPNGQIVVVGTFQEFGDAGVSGGIALARYNTDGSLDQTFGTGGEVLTDFGADLQASAAGVAIAPNGEIIVAATSNVEGVPSFTLLDYVGVKSGRGRR
jgi:uncharacterized delta-60 repeat protein